jgi:ribonuclease J
MASKQEELVFVPLGGLGEIGMNSALYGFGGGRKQWLMVDLGVSFGGPDTPGIDLVMPDLRFAEAEKKAIQALIITHAHEDHYGALADLWPRLGCPVYMTPFAASLFDARRQQETSGPKVPVKIMRAGDVIELGPFSVEVINVAHSIPESCALAITTAAGTVIHTGDWKIDPTPPVGLPTDEKRFRELGDKGVLALICDSTNAVREGISPSEAEVSTEIGKIISESTGRRVAVTTFASNIARIRAVAEAAQAHGREVVVLGRAMDRAITVAKELGLLEGLRDFRGQETFGYLPRENVVALLTGSQGEPRAALAKIAFDEHKDIGLTPGDRVIFSSRTIPGNEKEVGRIVNALVKQGIEVITDRERLVHVSGHPRLGELKMMYDWVRPQIAVPAHGEALHLTLHAEFAKKMGVASGVRPFNGDVVRLWPGKPEVIDQVPAGRIHKDGMIVTEATDPAIAERKKLSFAGVVSVAIAIDSRGELLSTPEIEFAGLPLSDGDGGEMEDIVADAVDTTVNSLGKTKRRDPDLVESAVERAVRAAVSKVWDKKPMVHVLVVTV